MLASQLLRILQSIPNDEKHENSDSVADPAEPDTRMKENHNTTLSDAKNLEEADPMALESEEYQLNGSKGDSSPLTFEAKDGGVQRWNPFLDDSSVDNESVSRDSPRMEQQNELSYEVGGLENDADSLTSDRNDEPKMPEHELSVILEEFTQFNENECVDSSSPHATASDLRGTEMNLYTDKNVLDCELPELIVCYKDINHHIVKDISVDEGMAVKDKVSIESCKDDKSDPSFLQPPDDNNQSEGTEGEVEIDFFVSDGIASSLLENTKGLHEDEHGDNEESHGDVVAQELPNSPPRKSFQKDIAKRSDVVESVQQTCETNSCATTVTKASKEDSFIDRKLPIQEFGTRSFLRSFMSSLDFEENKLAQLSEQIPSEKAVSVRPAASIAETVPKEDVQNRSLLYKSKVENGSITFNFNSPPPAVGGVPGSTEDFQEQSIDSREVHDHNLLHAGMAQCKNFPDRSLNTKDENFNEFSSQVQFRSNNNVHGDSPTLKDGNSDDLLAYISKSDGPSSMKNGLAITPNVLQHERQNSDNVSVVSLSQDDVGESSFSAAGGLGLITYPEPIPPSANISLRSDGSTTSARSFAFPVLQPEEWSSSPVRMGKTDGKDFRKHKGWRSGLFCCRF